MHDLALHVPKFRLGVSREVWKLLGPQRSPVLPIIANSKPNFVPAHFPKACPIGPDSSRCFLAKVQAAPGSSRAVHSKTALGGSYRELSGAVGTKNDIFL